MRKLIRKFKQLITKHFPRTETKGLPKVLCVKFDQYSYRRIQYLMDKTENRNFRDLMIKAFCLLECLFAFVENNGKIVLVDSNGDKALLDIVSMEVIPIKDSRKE